MFFHGFEIGAAEIDVGCGMIEFSRFNVAYRNCAPLIVGYMKSGFIGCSVMAIVRVQRQVRAAEHASVLVVFERCYCL